MKKKENKQKTWSKQFQIKQKDLERSKTDIPSAQIHDCLLSSHRTRISIKGGRKTMRRSNRNQNLSRTAFRTLLE